MIQTITSLIDRIEFDHNFKITFPDGSSYQRGDSDFAFHVILKTERSLRELIRHPSIGLGESYMAEEIDFEGDIQLFYHLGFLIKGGHIKPSLMESLRFAVGYFLRRNTLEGSRKNIAAHYDLGNEFYSLWLDREAKQYTCAYFETREDSLEQAQLNKLDLVCRKLRLQPGDTVVEAGCGWGGLGLHAARKYGVNIRSYNISKEQIAYAREKAERLGVTNVEYVLDDYRNIGADGRKYDKFVSIGMLEHVGVENYGKFYDIIERVVKPNGLALVHSIGREASAATDPWMEKYIFPGSRMPSLGEIVSPVEVVDRPLHVVDVENLRYHYALTLDHWVARLEDHADQIRTTYSESFYRMFRMYLHASAAGFRWGGIQLFQTLLCNGYDNEEPLTRHHFLGLPAPKSRGANGSKRSPTRAKSLRAGAKKAAGKTASKKKAVRKKAARSK
ncbi:MAG: cyclopropane-fatty-acyl-phospholipid synthase family protein [bacterium]|nr:cyclopropane-fatty-acyl-phospholipid synthase family protein [bacterium]